MQSKSKKMQLMVEEWQQSEISPRQFCEKNRIKLSTFGYWVQKFNEAKIPDPGFATLRISPEVIPDYPANKIGDLLPQNLKP
jgi:hypothetical protein